MAKLPRRRYARVAFEKVTRYLLDRTHPYGRGKSIFFESFGFTLDDGGELHTALWKHALVCDVIKTEDNEFGRKYVLEGPLLSPDGRNPLVRSVWIIETKKRFFGLPLFGSNVPKFVTAYPAKGDHES